ncbi:hypothetical protein KBY96_14945 [Cyanobium sp. ATX 6A2]|uniref:hypothetical protein n=1 Tax=Cyanobium sp. ATX 6A2 TaxID=2823700 RepID=UPI0020CC9918|nr:hypothetical protein [Cyanobium sp. ATX 6A2]MCP9889216.1 hypothetical protein [Cyanobium sp. ATX 6A2]
MSSYPLPAGRHLLLVSLACGTLLLAACSRDQPEAELQDPAAEAAPTAVAPLAAPAATADVSGFTSLPSTNQVLASNPIGRSDPFASYRPAPAITASPQPGRPAPPPPLQLPPDFLFSGVIRVGASPQAMVQLGPNSGALSIGALGGRTTDLLPAGWAVSSIDVGRGRLVLRQGGQTVTAEL